MNQNKYFGTDGIRGKVGHFPIVPDFVFKLGWAVGKVLSNYGIYKVILGKDTRISGYMLESVLESGLSYSGLSVVFTGFMPTPGIAYLTRACRSVAGIIISASHNPFYDNGIKLFFIDGQKSSIQLERAIELELEKNLISVKLCRLGKSSRIIDASVRYIEFCKENFPRFLSLKDLKIVLDCANGATYHIAPTVLRELGATVICIGCQPNGININEECGTTDIRQLQNMVLSEGANVGIAYDGDGDRVIMVDHFGNKVDGDQILYIIARDRQYSSQLLGGVVGTQMSNIGLELALRRLNIPFIRSYVGDRYVFSMMQKQRWYVGGENSGHIILLDKMTTGDGIIACLQVLLVMVTNQMTLYDLCQGIYLFPQILLNIRCASYQSLLTSCVVQKTIKEVEQELGQYGRVLLRISGTEPYVRVMIEGEYYDRVLQLSSKISDVLTNIL